MNDSALGSLIRAHILGGDESGSKSPDLDNTSMLSALSLRRTLPTTLLPMDQVESPEWSTGVDPIFQKKYSAFLEGNLTVYNTRVSLSNVRPGFYLHQRGGGFDYRCDEPPRDVVDDLAKAIREGHRSTLYLYGNVNESGRNPPPTLHYQHTLHSALVRLDDTLHSILLLAREGLWYQAVPLVRVLYERSLNFYLDWLAPETMHPFLALSAECHVRCAQVDASPVQLRRGQARYRCAPQAT